MGKKLSLSIVRTIHQFDNKWFGLDKLELDKDYDLYDIFDDLEQLDEDNVPVFKITKGKDDIFDYLMITDQGIKRTTECLNGAPLTYTKVKYLNEKVDPKQLNTTDWNKKVLEFISYLPDETCIVFEWS